MLIYRVEHLCSDDHRGPYMRWSGNPVDSVRDVHGDAVPDFSDVGIDWLIPSMRFGFASMDQLREWFDADARARLDRLGYVIAVYEVDAEHNLVRGRRQVMFQLNPYRPRNVPADHTPLVRWLSMAGEDLMLDPGDLS